MSAHVLERLDRALAVLVPLLDIARGRLVDGTAPEWCEARGFTGALLALDDEALRRCEIHGLGAGLSPGTQAARDLLDLARAVEGAARLPSFDRTDTEPLPRGVRGIGDRKAFELRALLGAVGSMAPHAKRIVDIGAGRGHFTRLASVRFDVDALGVDRDVARLESAALLAEGAPRAHFVAADVCVDALPLGAGDLAVGLHACGEAGDHLVTAASEAGAAVALVPCCPQKIRGAARAPLSARAVALVLARDVLGLANLAVRVNGVEASLEENLDARRARHCLRWLLRARGIDAAPGEELRGINRRRAHRGLEAIAGSSLALRGLAPPTRGEIDRASDEGSRDHARMRRLSLPRAMIARLVEVAIVLDRAARLVEAGYDVRAGELVPLEITPRNLAVFASRSGAGLPAYAPTKT